MKCHIAADLLPLYAEHLTSEETAAALEAHLAECESCAAQYAMIQESGTPAITAPEDIKPLAADVLTHRIQFYSTTDRESKLEVVNSLLDKITVPSEDFS